MSRLFNTRLYVILAVALVLLPLALGVWLIAYSQVGKPYAGFMVQPNSYLSPFQRSDMVGIRAGLRPEDILLSVDRKPVVNVGIIRQKIAAAGLGETLRYEVLRGGVNGRRLVVPVPVTRYEWADLVRDFASQFAVGLGYLILGSVILWIRPGSPSARAFFHFALAIGAFYLTYFDANSTHVLAFICMFATTMMGSAFLHLAMIFPAPLGIVRRATWLAWVPLGLGALLGIACGLSLQAPGLSASTPAAYEAAFYLVRFSSVWLFLCIVGFIALLPFHYIGAGKHTVERQQAGICLAGGIIGFFPVGVLYGLPFVAQKPPLIGLDNALIWIIVFPVSIGYAIVRHKLFDIEVVVRRSALYSVLTLILGAVYVGISTALEHSILVGLGWRSIPAGLVATGLVVSLFVPLRDRLRLEIDRRFFRQAYDVQNVVEAVSTSLVSLLDLEQITDRILRAATETMHAPVGALYVLAAQAGEFQPAAWVKGPPPAALALGQGVAREIERGEILTRVILPVQKPHRVSDKLGALEAEIILPFCSQGRVSGFLALGPKLSERPYNDSDLALLVTLANQGAIAIANALRLRDLTLARDNLAKSDKLAALGKLAAGVAHELNTPLGVIKGQLQLLGGGVAQEDLDRIHRQVSKMERIVQDLLQFGRPSPGEFAQVDLRNLIGNVVRLLQMADPGFRRIQVVNAIDPEVPPLWADSSRLEQVFLNLLSNAAHATAGRPGPEIRITAAPRDRHLVVCVADNGCGISEANLGKIFDPFFTTKGVGTGNGLGLAIAFGIVEEHGGWIEAESEVDVGTRIKVGLQGMK